MTERVVDASVLLAVALGERVDSEVLRVLAGAVMSTVNVAEVIAKLSSLSDDGARRGEGLLSLLGRIEPFTLAQAELCGRMRAITSHAGLGLGDRACLALALELDATVYTADKAWADVRVGCAIRFIR